MTRSFAGNRKDSNQAEVEQALIKAGYQAVDMSSVGKGFPDLLVVSKTRRIVLLEVKAIGGKFTKPESKFIINFTGPVSVVRSAEDALEVMQNIDEEE